MNIELMQALEDIEKDKGIPKATLLDAIETALKSAYRRDFGGSGDNINVEIEQGTGEVNVFVKKIIVEEVSNDEEEISLEAALKKNPNYSVGDQIDLEVTPGNFGRIAAQTAKQVVIQRIREAERDIIFEEFVNREGDILTGLVQREHKGNIIIDLGKTEAVLIPNEQIQTERHSQGDRVKVYVVEVNQTTKGPNILVSRTHPGLLKRLFELEVPEIHDGVVEIKSVAREAGHRSKVAVHSNQKDVDAVGACVGPNGARVRAIVSELSGEKVDIVQWNEDVEKFIANSLSPAEVVKVDANKESNVARVVVPDYQLSLAIGKEGQNARLAAKLTGWKIDIKSESQLG